MYKVFINDKKISINFKISILLDLSSSIEDNEIEYKKAAVALCEVGLPFIPTVGFASAGTIIHRDGIKLPDVFEQSWRAGADKRASEVCSRLAEHHNVLGWLTDDDLSWGGAKEKPSLLQVCLSLEPSFAAYHAAWEFVLAPHGGQIARLAKAWSCTLDSKGVVREMTRAETLSLMAYP